MFSMEKINKMRAKRGHMHCIAMKKKRKKNNHTR
jgi:hypothetical protein